MVKRNCKTCSTVFEVNSNRSKTYYCSNKCKLADNTKENKSKPMVNGSYCKEWQKSTDGCGYGLFSLVGDGYNVKRAHRVAYKEFKGPIESGNVIMHLCDNPLCCNPDHLEQGTQIDNIQDMVSKNRQSGARGSNAAKAKLTEEQVKEIVRRHRAGGITYADLGREYGVNENSISAICRGQTWSHVTGIIDPEAESRRQKRLENGRKKSQKRKDERKKKRELKNKTN